MANFTNLTTNLSNSSASKLAAKAIASANNTTTAALDTVKNEGSNWAIAFFTVALPEIAYRFWLLIAAPFKYSHMQWILIPLTFTFVLTEFYFFRHTDEELGWNSALLNSLVLVFVAIDLVKTVFPGETPWQVFKTFGHALMTGENLSMLLTIIFIGGLGLALVIINYFHMLPRKLAYLVSSHPPVNFIAFFSIVIVYSAHDGHPIPLDIYTVIAATLLFTLIVAIIFFGQQMLGTKNTSYYSRIS